MFMIPRKKLTFISDTSTGSFLLTVRLISLKDNDEHLSV